MDPSEAPKTSLDGYRIPDELEGLASLFEKHIVAVADHDPAADYRDDPVVQLGSKMITQGWFLVPYSYLAGGAWESLYGRKSSTSDPTPPLPMKSVVALFCRAVERWTRDDMAAYLDDRRELEAQGWFLRPIQPKDWKEAVR